MRSRRTHSNAFTLIELLVVIAIIGLLATLLIPAVMGAQAAMDEAKTLDLVQGLHTALKIEKTAGKGYPMPDNDPVAAVGSPEERVGFFMYDKNETKPYLINRFMNGQNYVFDMSNMMNDQGVVIDSWGEPLHYVLGDYKNRIGNTTPAYDATKPQDSNKPKDAGKTAAESDWNSKDEGKFPYVYSVGPEQLEESWIYYVD